MAMLTTDDIKTIDELSEMDKDDLANEDSLLTYDKDMNCHKKFKVSALRAWMTENERNAKASEDAAAAYKANAATSAANAASSETNAAASESNAASSAAAAASSETNAATSETNAAASESNAATSAVNAATSEANAASSEINAATAETNAAASEANAATSEANAAASETNAATSESNAATSESNAASSAAAAADSAVLAESWAAGGTGSRTGEDTNNAKYFSQQAAASEADARESKDDAASILAEVRALLSGGSMGGATVVVIDGSAVEAVDTDKVFRLQTGAQLEVQDPTRFFARATFVNETAAAVTLTMTLSGGGTSMSLNKGATVELVWNGSFWRPAFPEVPAGTVWPLYTAVVPDGWFLCDGTDTTGTADELATCYPTLYARLGNSNVIPDLRECALVGAGENTHDAIATHDVYTLGQFKDDQIQNITGTIWQGDGWGGPNHNGNGAFSVVAMERRTCGFSRWGENQLDGWNFDASRVARAGTTTRGKRKGVNYIIKA
jgi:hypothetical protein